MGRLYRSRAFFQRKTIRAFMMVVIAGSSSAAGAGEVPELLAGTYSGADARATSACLTADGSVYVVGRTDDPGLPEAINSKAGYSDIYIQKFSADLSTLHWSRYLGGVGEVFHQEIATDCAATPDGGIVLTGQVETPDFPTTNALDTTLGGESDAFVTRLDADGNVVFSTYLGGSGQENLMYGIANFSQYHGEIEVASNGQIIVAGITRSEDFPTVNAFDDTFGGFQPDVFVTRMTGDGQDILASTFLGDLYTDEVYDLDLDDQDRIVITGEGGPGWPKSAEGWSYGDLTSSGLVYVSRFAADLQTLEYTAWLERIGDTGGRFGLYALGIAPNGAVIVGGQAGDNFPPMPDDAYQPELMGGSPTRDILVLALSPDGSTLTGATYLGTFERGEFTVALDVNSHGEVVLARNYEKNPVTSRVYSLNHELTALTAATITLVSPGTTQSLMLDHANNLLAVASGLGTTTPEAYSRDPEGGYIARYDMKRPPAGSPGDLNGDGTVDINDLLQLLTAWGACVNCPPSCTADLNGDCEVSILDLLILLGNWS